MFSRSLLFIPCLLVLLVAYSSLATSKQIKNKQNASICFWDANKRHNVLAGHLNSERKFVPQQGNNAPSGDCQCDQSNPPRLSCQEPIQNGPWPSVADVYCSDDDNCSR
ncbi:hypothetical protein PGT21_031430 [Puccinia graminis f. sp. tritici]|uniref:Uncharacterized protein n=1 Tax=Puccinia graminis f. sp. tritici TaxID=56615 RepID=A0A5B0LQT8_PUCGR|nr:hypothetical protein PGT21_031430 [Puccinia graminis f. sp. tritici]KAA1081914.1 hypothetical protein PGTUg99_028060 [Puccinia graminis f. sp. tritici]